MSSWVRELMAQNLRRPKGFAGHFVSRYIFDKTVFLEQNAARLCRIQPHHKVLEVGFGPGYGLKEAYSYVKDGAGIIYGIELSETMLKKASHKLQPEIQKGKVDLSFGSVTQLPYNTDMFDSVFHCDCFYFWTDMKVAVRELYRVMKPGSTMVSTMSLAGLRRVEGKGFLKYGNTDPVHFMWMLQENGFEDVRFEYMSDGKRKFEAIFAKINEKSAYDEEFQGELESESNGRKTSSQQPVTGHIQPLTS